MSTLDTTQLHPLGLQELDADALVATRGGIGWGAIGAIAMVIAWDIINHPDDAVQGFNDGWNAAGH